jgi:hypothetical protein
VQPEPEPEQIIGEPIEGEHRQRGVFRPKQTAQETAVQQEIIKALRNKPVPAEAKDAKRLFTFDPDKPITTNARNK